MLKREKFLKYVAQDRMCRFYSPQSASFDILTLGKGFPRTKA